MVTFNAFLFDWILTMMEHYANEVPFPRSLKAMQIEYIIFPFIEYSSLFPYFIYIVFDVEFLHVG